MATRTISTKLAVEGESEYRSSMTRINNEIKTLNTNLKLAQSEYQNNANSMAALTAKGDALNALYNAQVGKVRELQAALNNAQNAEAAYAAKKQELKEKIDANNEALDKQDAIVIAAGRSWANQAEIVSRCEKELDALKKTSGDTSDAQTELEKKISAAKDKMADLETRTGGAAKSTGELLLENKNLDAELKQTEQYLDAAGRGVTNWQGKLNAAKVEQNNLNAKIELNNQYLDEARKSADGCATSIDRFGKQVKGSADKASELRDALAAAGVIAALKATADAMEACVDSSIEFESSLAGVAKTTDLTEAELSDMADAIQDLSTHIPATTSEIAGVVEAAGQLGIAKGDLLSFSEVMVNLGVATNLTSTEAATALAKFANVVGMSSENYERLGSVIVDLGNNFATTEADIVSMATRLASTGSIVGLTEPQIMAIATALSSVGIEAEAGGSAISKLLKQFETMVATGNPKLEKFAAVAGMSADEFSQKWGEDAVGALSLFIDGLGRIDDAGGSSVAVLDDLGITELRLSNAVQALSSSHGILEKSLKTADSAWSRNTALAKEAATRYETTESKLQMLSNACDNVKIAIGDKLTPAVGNLASTGTEVLSWTADMIDDSSALVPLITSVATAIGVLASGLVAYAAVTKLASAAMGLFNAALDANPVFLAVTAIAALAAGIGVLVASINDDAIPSVKELTTVAQELPDAFAQANDLYAESETKILATSSAVEKYIDRLRELEAQGVTTEEQQAEYAQTVDKLRYLLPDVNIEIDKQTGLLVDGADALDDQVAGWKAVALQQALATKYKDQIKAFADAELEAAENQQKLIGAQAEADTISTRLAEVQAGLTANYEEQNAVVADATLTAEEQRQKLFELQDAALSLSSELGDLQYQLNENTDYQETLSDAVAVGTETAAEYAQQVDEAQKALDDYERSANGAADGMDGLSDSMAGNQQAAQELRDDIQSLAKSYKEAYDSAYDSISGQIGLFDTFAAKVSDDTDTVEKMMDRWAQQTKNLAAYTENLQKAAQYGLDDGLVASLSDGSAESAGYLATIIDKIEELGGTTADMSADANDFVTEFNASFERTEEAKESFAATVAAIETNLDEAVQQLEKRASEVDFSGFGEALNTAFANAGVDFQKIGTDAGIGLAQGVSNSSGRVADAAADVANEATVAAKNELGEHSPSTVFKEIGENADVGMEQGVKGKISVVLAAVKSMGQQMTTQMEQSAKQTVDAYDKDFAQIVNRTSITCSSIVSVATGTTSQLPGAMADIGAQAVNGMINGLNSRSSLLYYTISSIVSNAIASARNAAAVHSPSKKTTEIFEFVGDGMVVGLENRRQKVKDTAQSVVNDALNMDVDGKIKSAIGSIDARIPLEFYAAAGTAPAMAGAPSGQGNVIVHVSIEHFENRSDRDLDAIAEYVEESIQDKIYKREASL